MIIFTILFALTSVVLGYTTFVQFRKVEFYEKTVNEFYSRLSITLHAMRVIDERQMFERDDEVGEIFNQLTDVVNELRPLIYGSRLDGETSQESVG